MDVILVFLQVSWRDSGTRLKDQENLLRQVSIPNANNHCVFHHFPGLCSRSFSFFHLSMPLSLHTYVRPGVHASMPPCLHASIPPCLQASVPLCHCPPIPPSIYPLVLHPIACIQSWFLVFLQDHFWQRQQLKRTLSESMLLPISFGKPTVRCICKCLRRKKWSLDRWSLVGFHLILLLLCSTPPRRLTSNERYQTL